MKLWVLEPHSATLLYACLHYHRKDLAKTALMEREINDMLVKVIRLVANLSINRKYCIWVGNLKDDETERTSLGLWTSHIVVLLPLLASEMKSAKIEISNFWWNFFVRARSVVWINVLVHQILSYSKQFAENKSIDTQEELVLNVISAITNLSFYHQTGYEFPFTKLSLSIIFHHEYSICCITVVVVHPPMDDRKQLQVAISWSSRTEIF